MTRSYSNWFVRARLKTRQLQLLAAMEEEGNVRRAADVLGMTQPAASRLLKELEDMLEVSLFDRTPHGMRATLYGEVMIRHARMVLSNLSHAHEEIGTARRSGRPGAHWRDRRGRRDDGAARHRQREGTVSPVADLGGGGNVRRHAAEARRGRTGYHDRPGIGTAKPVQ